MIHQAEEESQCALFEEPRALDRLKKPRRSSSKLSKPEDFGLTAPSQFVKNYVLDTNVLLHDPASLERFKENHLCIPVDVLAELDKFKSEQTERGANARRGAGIGVKIRKAGPTERRIIKRNFHARTRRNGLPMMPPRTIQPEGPMRKSFWIKRHAPAQLAWNGGGDLRKINHQLGAIPAHGTRPDLQKIRAAP